MECDCKIENMNHGKCMLALELYLPNIFMTSDLSKNIYFHDLGDNNCALSLKSSQLVQS